MKRWSKRFITRPLINYDKFTWPFQLSRVLSKERKDCIRSSNRYQLLLHFVFVSSRSSFSLSSCILFYSLWSHFLLLACYLQGKYIVLLDCKCHMLSSSRLILSCSLLYAEESSSHSISLLFVSHLRMFYQPFHWWHLTTLSLCFKGCERKYT